MRHLLQLRERLGLDTNPNPTTKTEKDVCNLAARASTSPVHMVIPPSPQTPIKDGNICKLLHRVSKVHWFSNKIYYNFFLFILAIILSDREYTTKEQELLMKCINLIQGRMGSNMNNTLKVVGSLQSGNIHADASPSGDESCSEICTNYVSSNSIELCSPDRIDIPNGWEAPAPPVQPMLQPLRLYVPELEEIRISPVVARKG